MRRRWLVACLSLCALRDVAAEDHDSNIGEGPFLVSSQSPFQALRLGLLPRAPSSLRGGEYEAYVSDTWTNTWVDQPHYQLDFERMNLQAALGMGLNHRWEIEGAVISRVTFGGWLDGFVQDVHSALGMDQNGRDAVAKGRTVIHIDPTDGQPGIDLDEADLDGRTEIFGRLSSWYTICDGGGRVPTVSATLAAQTPLHHYTAYQGGYVDLAGGLAVAKRFGGLYTYLVGNYTRYGPDRIYGVHLYQGGFSGLIALEGGWIPRLRPIVQYLISQGIAPDYYSFSSPSHELTLGVKVGLSRRATLEVAMMENLFVFDNSPDFGLHAGCSVRW